MRVTPKMIERPLATRKSDEAVVRPVRNWMRRKLKRVPVLDLPGFRRGALIARPHLLDLGVARKIFRAILIGPIDHDALAVPHIGLPDIGPHGRLMVDGA